MFEMSNSSFMKSQWHVFPEPNKDIDPVETQEWKDALEAMIKVHGKGRGAYMMQRLAQYSTELGIRLPPAITTPYCNTLKPAQEKALPGDMFLERRIRSIIRWNAMAMVHRANQRSPGLGGHMSTFSSSATLYEIGFNHFFRAKQSDKEADLIFFQGHSSPGIYARSFLEGRFDERRLDSFREEVSGQGLSSYPHPWLMPDYWQFPTVSMGLGPMQAIYQAHIIKYQQSREIVDHGDRKVWCFIGDGETDEPETLAALALAGREELDNLIFVVNCNLQRLDGPVRGNGKIVQELEGAFRGAGWNVLKVLWGRHWDKLFERDKTGLLQKRMDEVCDGELQNYKANGGAYTREHFFGKYPELLELVKDMSDDDIMKLNRGGHDPYKVYAAYHAASQHKGQPSVVLAQTVKGYGMGDAGESQNETHSLKKLDRESLREFRRRFDLPIDDEALYNVEYFRPNDDSPELKYLKERRQELGGFIPSRRNTFEGLTTPELSAFSQQLTGSGEREISTTMAFVRMLSTLAKDEHIKDRIVPIVPDEARTFGMEGMFRQLGIYSSQGQHYTPHDSGQIMYYKESKKGQILEEGINEAGALSAWIAAATSYSVHNYPMVPFFIFYSMFGFQRVMDLIWAAGDSQARGFLMGATSGRTTLNGEGLQHQDGHSHLMANMIPNCRSYDPSYAYELAVILQHGLHSMYSKKENVFYYITVMNENYIQPNIEAVLDDEIETGIVKGMYLYGSSATKETAEIQLMGCGTILNEVRKASKLLLQDWGITSNIWSLTSINQLRNDGMSCERWNLLNPNSTPRVPYIAQKLASTQGSVIAATDYIKAFPDLLRPYIDRNYTSLGTDGYGRSDTRQKLREFFEIDANYICIAALSSLVDSGRINKDQIETAIKRYQINPERPDPMVL
jgi:pyruvate dehydrogenase E1 component